MNETLSSEERLTMQLMLQEHKTNHVLHLLLTIVTVGAWMIVWLIVSSLNTNKRNAIKKQYGLSPESNLAELALLALMCLFALVFVFPK